jgi:hypothetical protein
MQIKTTLRSRNKIIISVGKDAGKGTFLQHTVCGNVD